MGIALIRKGGVTVMFRGQRIVHLCRSTEPTDGPELFTRKPGRRNWAGVEFCITDATTALTFLDLVDSSADVQARPRRLQEAHRAYKTIVDLLQRLTPYPEEQIILKERLGRLPERLITAGVSLDDLPQSFFSS